MIFNSPYPKVAIPELPLTPFVFSQFSAHGENIAIINGVSGEKFTFSETASLIRRAAGGFQKLGIRQGDVVAIYAPNSPEYIFAFHGLSWLGVTTTTINPAYTPGEVERQMEDAGASYLITLPTLLEGLSELSMLKNMRGLIVFGEAQGATSFESIIEADEVSQYAELDPHQSVVALPYSSGTTGLSKGVMITHRNLVANVCQVDGVIDYSTTDASDNLVAVLPFYHIYGMMIFMSLTLYQGATLVTLPRFDLEQFLGILQDFNITRAYIAPPIAVALAKHPSVENYKLDHLRIVFSGAAPLGAELSKEVEARIGCEVIQGYGLTETSPVTNVGPDTPGKKKYGSIGPPICNTEMKVIDLAEGNAVTRNIAGEVCIRGPQLMKGYLHNPEATANCIDDDGWFHTGDIGYADEDGYFFIVDRVKELIKYKGYQVAPAELEALLLTHEAVADAAVIGISDVEAGELPKGFIVKKGEVTADQIIEFVAENVAPYKKLRLVEFIDTIPKAPSGKILRRMLRDS